MPTAITHAVVGIGLARLWMPERRGPGFLTLSALASAAPDADALLFSVGLADHTLSHRGPSHSLFFAGCSSLAIVVLAFRRDAFSSARRGIALWAYFAFVMASHGLLDMLTNGGAGIEVLAPFDDRRFFWVLRPIDVAPLRIADFFSAWGLRVLESEMLWVWTPLAVVLALAWLAGRARGRRDAT